MVQLLTFFHSIHVLMNFDFRNVNDVNVNFATVQKNNSEMLTIFLIEENENKTH